MDPQIRSASEHPPDAPASSSASPPRLLFGLAVVSFFAVRFGLNQPIGQAIRTSLDSHVHRALPPMLGWLEAAAFAAGFAGLAFFWRDWACTSPPFGPIHFPLPSRRPAGMLIGTALIVTLVNGIAAIVVAPTTILSWWLLMIAALTVAAWSRDHLTLQSAKRVLNALRTGPTDSPQGKWGPVQGKCVEEDHYTQRFTIEADEQIDVRTDRAVLISTASRVVQAREQSSVRSRVEQIIPVGARVLVCGRKFKAARDKLAHVAATGPASLFVVVATQGDPADLVQRVRREKVANLAGMAVCALVCAAVTIAGALICWPQHLAD